MAYTDVGSGPIIVGIHGCPGSVKDWRWLGVPLEANARFIRLELPGFGETPLRTGPNPSLAGRGHIFIEALDALDIASCIVVAHSAGGLVALEAAARYSERIQGVALIAVPGGRPHRPVRHFPQAQWVSRGLRVPGLKYVLTQLGRRAFGRAGFPDGLPSDTVRQTLHIVAHMDFQRQRENIGRIEQSTLVAWADDDQFIEAAIGQELAESLPPGPRLPFQAGGHYIQKTQSVEIGRTLLHWIDDAGLFSGDDRHVFEITDV